MTITTYQTYHLVKSEDLNHHGTLYAGRNAEWFVESGFVAAASLTRPENILCLKIHGMEFTRPVHLGEIICFESKIIDTGHSRIVAYIAMKSKEQVIVKGFITFVNADQEGRPLAHGITITPETQEDVDLQMQARSLKIK
jgi:acyl-CoA hydrolase